MIGARWLHQPENVLRTVIYVNAGMYLLSLLIDFRSTALTFDPLTFLSPSNNSLLFLGATGTIPIDRFHRWWTLIAANFLHGGMLHIVFNMLALRQVAPLIWSEFGPHRSIILYLVTGTIGFWISYLAGVPFTIGASAAVCGMIGAAVYYGWSRGGHHGQMIYRQMGTWALGLLAIGFILPGINNWGHVGGLLSGAGLAFAMGYREKRAAAPVIKAVAMICILITLAVLAWAVVTGTYYAVLTS